MWKKSPIKKNRWWEKLFFCGSEKKTFFLRSQPQLRENKTEQEGEERKKKSERNRGENKGKRKQRKSQMKEEK